MKKVIDKQNIILQQLDKLGIVIAWDGLDRLEKAKEDLLEAKKENTVQTHHYQKIDEIKAELYDAIVWAIKHLREADGRV